MNTISRYLADIRLWIFILFLIRLEQINLPPLDAHAYRQALTLGVARNFLEWDANIFQPRSILCGAHDGREVMEFPVLNYAIFLMWKIFGQHHWCFRLLGLLVASWGLWHFFQIAQRITGERAAKAATLFLGTSICFIYARKAMPDVFSLSLVMAGVDYGWRYLEKGGWRPLLAFGICCSLGILSKIPAATAAVLLFYPMLDRQVDMKRKMKLIMAGIAALLPVVAWYFVWIPWAEQQYAHGFYFRLGWKKAWAELFTATDFALFYTKEKFTSVALLSQTAFMLGVIGVVLAIDRFRLLFALLLLYSAVFFYFMLQVGGVFSGHEYYVIPFVPVMALLAGYGADQLFKTPLLFYAVILGSAVYAVHKKKSDFFIEYRDQRFVHLQAITDQVVPKNAKVITITYPTLLPTMMYATGRRGWSEENAERAKDTHWLEGEAAAGLEYVIADRRKLLDSLPYPMLYEDNEFRIYKIEKHTAAVSGVR